MKQHLHFLPVVLLFLSAKYGCPLAAVVCDHDHVSFRVERVASVEECLDVLVFRGMSLRSERNGKTADETDVDTAALLFKQQLRAKLPRSIQEFEAGGGRIVQFAAVVASKEATATDVNDVSVVVGAIDAQVEASVRARTFELPDRVHVKNLRVHENYRRKGIGRALLSAVEQFALGETTRTATPEAVTLKVEQHSNPKAVQLYEQEGFVFQEQVYFGFMLKTINRKE